MSIIIPRPYQTRGVNAFFDYYDQGGRGDVLMGYPTGAGKSLIPALIIRRAMLMAPFARFAIVTHVKELIAQNAKAAKMAWPLMPMGICSAGLKKKESYAQVVFGGIGTMVNMMDDIGHRDVIFVDEAHMISNDEDSQYRRFVKRMREINPRVKFVGLTATLFRMGQGTLLDGTDENPALFDETIIDLTTGNEFVYFIDEFYLARLTPRPVETVIDVTDVRITNFGDYDKSQLAERSGREEVTRAAVAETMAYGQDRKQWMIFGAGVKNCYQLKELFRSVGIETVVVHGNSKQYPITDQERDSRIEAFKRGYVRGIISNNILLTGFDCPGVDLIVDLRPTTSINTHVQKYGRGTRQKFHPAWTFEMLRDRDQRKAAMLAGDKANGCMILDFAGNRGRLGAINDPKIPSKKKGCPLSDCPLKKPGCKICELEDCPKQAAPQKICPNCGTSVHPTSPECGFCGHKFEFKVNIKKQSQTEELIKFETDGIELLKCKSWNISVKRKAGKRPCLKITYWCGSRGLRSFDTYLYFEHDKPFVVHNAREWWRKHYKQEGFVPDSSEEAYQLVDKLVKPDRLKVDTTKAFPIMEYMF